MPANFRVNYMLIGIMCSKNMMTYREKLHNARLEPNPPSVRARFGPDIPRKSICQIQHTSVSKKPRHPLYFLTTFESRHGIEEKEIRHAFTL
jgi:hypothetical protein